MATTLPFEKSLKKMNILFKYSGMNVYKINNLFEKIKCRSLFAFNVLSIVSASVVSIFYITYGISEGMIVEVMGVSPCVTFATLALIKSLFHFVHEARIIILNDNLMALEANDEEIDKEKESIVTKELGFLHAVLNVLFFLIISMLVVFDMTPLILMAVSYNKAGEFKMLLPYIDVCLFMPCTFGYWVIAYLHQIWSEVVSLLDMAAADCLFYAYCTHIRIQFRLLQYDFENLIPDERSSQNATEEQIKFNELVKRHQRLIESSCILEDIYSKSTLCNFLSSSVVICLTGFNVTVGDDAAMVMIYVTFLCMGLIQVFVFCLFADMMRSASVEVSDAAYNCKWYLRNKSFGKNILLVQIRAQEACKLTAAGFADVNLRAFMRVLSTAWSYFALLQTLYKS